MKTLVITTIVCFYQIFTFAQTTPLTLEEAVLGQGRQFAAERRQALNFLPQSDVYVYVKDNQIFQGDKSGKEKVWLTLDNLKAYKNAPSGLNRIPQLNWLNSAAAYFISEDNYYYTIDFKNRIFIRQAQIEGDGDVSDFHAKSGNFAFNEKNNLLVKTPKATYRVTDLPEGVVSGQSISRNEYGISNGTFWNEDGSLLAFYQKDERQVTEYPLINYKTEPATVKNIRYPMAGQTSELVRVGVFDTRNQKTIYLQLWEEENDQYYATNLAWSPDNTIYIILMSRKTDSMKLVAFDAISGKQRQTLFTESDDRWVEPTLPITFIPNSPNQFLFYSQRDGFHQWYKYDTSGKLLGKTKVAFEMTTFEGFDNKGEFFFSMGTGADPTESHLFKIRCSDMNVQQITKTQGVHSVRIAGSGKLFLDGYSNPNTPYKLDLLGDGGKVIKNLLISKNPLEGKTIGITELFTITGKSGIPLHCRLIKPHDFDPTKKYPVVVYVYNGPHVQLVTNSFLGGASLWMHYLAEQGYLVFTLDGRGSDHRGKQFEQAIHRQLGAVEMEDQLSGVEWLKQQPFVDSNRMGVHGWSFGGFMTTGLMLRAPGAFKVGVAGGPVIDWKLYEVMYTERYMDTPAENPEGYDSADLTKYVKNLQGKLLMIHGADDDVVVMQHNMKFLKTCIDQGVQVDFFAYPGHAHNVVGKDRVHLMRKVIDYLTSNL